MLVLLRHLVHVVIAVLDNSVAILAAHAAADCDIDEYYGARGASH